MDPIGIATPIILISANPRRTFWQGTSCQTSHLSSGLTLVSASVTHSTVLCPCYHLLVVEQETKPWVRWREITELVHSSVWTGWCGISLHTGNFHWQSHWGPVAWRVTWQRFLCLSAFQRSPNAAVLDRRGTNLSGRQEEGRHIYKSIGFGESLGDPAQVTWTSEFLFPVS